MADAQPHQSLELDVLDSGTGNITVHLRANSSQAQRVSYELQTRGTSTTAHRGTTLLQPNDPASLSNIRFSVGREWCVSLKVEEELGARYTITKGSACS